MPPLHKSAVALRFMGDDLIPGEITELLGASPTVARTKGEKIVGKHSGQERMAQFGIWLLYAADRSPEDMNAQIRETLSQMTDDLEVWQRLTKKYRTDLFCSLFMHDSNEGLALSPASLEALGSRGIELSLDVYGGSEEELDEEAND